MSAPASDPAAPRAFAMGFREFVALIAAMMAINALGIDAMLPALPAMGKALGIAHENDRQWIIAAYMLGLGACQIIYGPLIDRYGRKPILLLSLGFYALTCIAAAFAYDFETIVATRLLQGVAAAAARVLAVSIVRDRYSGRQMARVMSLTFIVFLAVPILAPSIGQLVMLVAPWETIFIALAVFAMMLALWVALRLPETLHPEDRQSISPASIVAGIANTLGVRASLGYTLAGTMLFGGLIGYINSVQQIFADTFHAPGIFTIVFALCAGLMGLASFLNSRIVERLGSRLVSHSALLGFIAVCGMHALFAVNGVESIISFCVFQSLSMGLFALAASNFNAMAMEPVGHIAGTAASVQGTIATVGGALVGLLIGQRFDGTTAPVAIGMFVVGLLSLGCVLVTERGRLFRSQHGASPAVVGAPVH